jgi:hypothetical protein
MLKEIIQNACLQRLKNLEPVRKAGMGGGKAQVAGGHIDDVITIGTDQGQFTFQTVIKGVLKRPIPEYLFHANEKAAPLMIMAEYINGNIADDLKQKKINFIDRAGNAFIRIPGKLFIDVQGKPIIEPKEKQGTALFNPKGLQFLFLLLTDPDALNRTVRMMGAGAGISTGWVVRCMQELREKGRIVKKKAGQIRLVNPKEMLEQWLVNYGDRLRPKLVLGAYKIAPSVAERAPELLQKAFPDDDGTYAIGGGLAGDVLLHYYRGATTEIFVRPENAENVRHVLKLIPAAETDATLLNLFAPGVIYRKQTVPHPIVHPLLIYAELLFQGGDRAVDAAGRIYDTYLKQYLNET